MTAATKKNAGMAPGVLEKTKQTVRELSAIARDRVKLAARDERAAGGI